mgnify:CR=1 FL=1
MTDVLHRILRDHMLAGVTITDPLLTVAGGPINLAVGASDSGTFTGSYVLTQADIDRTYLQNTALASGAAVSFLML